MAETKTVILKERIRYYEKGSYDFLVSAEILKQMEGNTYKILRVRLRDNGDNVIDPEIEFELVDQVPPKERLK